jgi:hypothetical protein
MAGMAVVPAMVVGAMMMAAMAVTVVSVVMLGQSGLRPLLG